VRDFWEGLQQLATDLLAWWQATTAAWVWWPDLVPWIVALLGLLLLALRRRRPARLLVAPPALLISQGEVALTGVEGDRSRRGASPAGALAGDGVMTLSNLSRYPVQVLEVAVRPSRRAPPRVASTHTLVPALGSAEIRCEIPLQLTGDSLLEVYFYAAAPKRKVYRHRVELVWEPWMRRFKVAPMDQVTTPVRRLPSVEPRAVLEIPEQSHEAPPVAAVPSGRTRAPVPLAPPIAEVAAPLPSASQGPRPPARVVVDAQPPAVAARTPAAATPASPAAVAAPPTPPAATPAPALATLPQAPRAAEPAPAGDADAPPRAAEVVPAEPTPSHPSAPELAPSEPAAPDAAVPVERRPQRNLSFPDKF